MFGCSNEAEKNLLIMVFQILQNLSLEIQHMGLLGHDHIT